MRLILFTRCLFFLEGGVRGTKSAGIPRVFHPSKAGRRRALAIMGLEELKQRFDAQVGPRAAQLNERLRELSDIRFTDTNRVPHCFQPVMRAKLRLGFISVSSDGPYLTDVDGNRALDVSGSYGVNVAGYEVYKRCVAEGMATMGALSPVVLGPLHPCIFDVLGCSQP